MLIYQVDFFAFLGGLLPALLWLWFWFREDAARPEPRLMVALTFLAGMLAVYIAVVFEREANEHIAKAYPALGYFSILPLYLAWAFIEEVAKFAVVAIVVLWQKVVDEPIDMMMYMIMGAIGFAALENAYYIQSPENATFLSSISAGNLRFLGATLLHTLCSAVVGLALATVFFKSVWHKIMAGILGVILATALHTAFNFFIIVNDSSQSTLGVFALVWFALILLILAFEGVKKLGRTPIRN